MSYTIGIDLGGSHVKTVVVSGDGETLANHNLPFDPGLNMDWGRCIKQIVSDTEAEQSAPAQSVGLSAPGSSWGAVSRCFSCLCFSICPLMSSTICFFAW